MFRLFQRISWFSIFFSRTYDFQIFQWVTLLFFRLIWIWPSYRLAYCKTIVCIKIRLIFIMKPFCIWKDWKTGLPQKKCFLWIWHGHRSHMLFLRVMFARARFIGKKFLVVIFCWNVLIGAPGRRLFLKINNPSKMLASVKLMYSYQEKIASTRQER